MDEQGTSDQSMEIDDTIEDQELTRVEAEIIEQLESLFGSESSGHDITHLIRTRNLAEHISAKEGGDKRVIVLASLLHDMHRLIQAQSGKFCPPVDSLSKVDEILSKYNLDQGTSDKIRSCIAHHEEYGFSETGKITRDLETMILQDADNLDAMGAIGIARAFAFGGSKNVPIWTPDIPLGREHFDESEPDPSEIHHFYSKLLKLKDNMNTETGKEMAQKRHEVMVGFLEEFFKEWRGES